MRVSVTISTPSAVTFSMSRSTTSAGSRHDGIARRSMPPGSDAASKIRTVYPRRASFQAAVSPAGPEPITATCFPFRGGASVAGPWVR